MRVGDLKAGDHVRIKKSAIRHYRTDCFNHAAENETPILVRGIERGCVKAVYSGTRGGVKFLDAEDLILLPVNIYDELEVTLSENR